MTSTMVNAVYPCYYGYYNYLIFHYTGSLIGFTNLGEVNNHLIHFQQEVLNKETSQQMPLAKSMLVIMVQGLCSNFRFPYVQFPCVEVSGDQLFDPFWESVMQLEVAGFKVMGLVCDGLSANRCLFCLHQSVTDDFVYKVQNPYSNDGRQIYFFSDPPHLLKTTRNAWSSDKRNLWVSAYTHACMSIHTML